MTRNNGQLLKHKYIRFYLLQNYFICSVMHCLQENIHGAPVGASAPFTESSSEEAVFVTVLVVVAVLVESLVDVLVTVVSAGPRPMKHEQADEIWRGPPSPSEMLIPPGPPMVMPIWRLLAGAGHEPS